jgi:predicted transposase YbfD/YdcC
MMVVSTQTSTPREGHPVSFSHSAGSPSSLNARAAWNAGTEDADISSLLRMLASVTDPRSPQGIQHALGFMLAVCVVAMLAGAGNYREIAGHAADIPQPLLKKLGAEWCWFRLRCKYPSESTIRNVLTRIDAAELDKITGKWLSAQARKDGKGEWVIALDGKVLRGAWTDENDKVTLFSAMLHREAVTIAQVRVPDGTNEITQAGTLLDTAGIPGGEPALVTLDAAHTQRETAETIAGKSGRDYLMTVKGNQPSLQRAVFDKILPLLPEAPHHVTEEHSRGRIKKWSCWITGAEGIDFPHAAQAAFIRREIFEISGDRISKEHALILTSRKTGKMTAADVNRHIRSHWGIENKSHYVRDTVYREDHGQAWAGNGPQALASLRNLALGLFRMKNVKANKETTEWVCRDQARALQFMTT